LTDNAEESFAPHGASVPGALLSSNETVAKAVGKALSLPLEKIQLEFFEGRAAGHANVLFSTCDVWHFYQLELASRFIVAVASRNPVQHVTYSDFQGFATRFNTSFCRAKNLTTHESIRKIRVQLTFS
jgi:hypothetical protein